MNIPLNLQNPLLFNNTLSDITRNNTDLLKNTSLLSDLTKPDLTTTALSSQFTNNNEILSNNLLLNLLCNNMNNQALPLNNNLNLLNMPYNPMNLFSLYGQNADVLNSLNNTQLQYLINNSNPTGDINLSNTDSFNSTSTSQSNNLGNSHSANDTLLSKESIDKTTLPTSTTSDSNIITDKLNIQDSHSGTSLDTEFLSNLFLNSNLSASNLDLLNLNPSTSNTKSSLDLLSDNLIPVPDLKASLNETLKSDIPFENPKENEKTDNLTNKKE